MVSRLEGTESAANAIARVKYTHDAMIDLVLANPAIRAGQLAEVFGYKQAWVSRIINSDAFQARLAERRSEMVDGSLLATLDARIKGAMGMSLDILEDKLECTKNADLALKVFDLTSRAAGYGARANQGGGGQNNQMNVVVVVPQKSENAGEWQEKYMNGAGLKPVIENEGK